MGGSSSLIVGREGWMIPRSSRASASWTGSLAKAVWGLVLGSVTSEALVLFDGAVLFRDLGVGRRLFLKRLSSRRPVFSPGGAGSRATGIGEEK